MATMTVELPEEIANRVRAEADRRGTTAEAVVLEAVTEKVGTKEETVPGRLPPDWNGLFDSKGVPPAKDFRRVNAETLERDILGDR